VVSILLEYIRGHSGYEYVGITEMERDSPIIKCVEIIGAIASILALVAGTRAVLIRPESSSSAGITHGERQEQPRNPYAVAKIGEYENNYGSKENLLGQIKTVESKCESLNGDMRALRETQRRFYSQKTFAGPSNLNSWRSEASRIREETRDAESDLSTMKRDYEAWIEYEAMLYK
jgi:hypothetical protein